jgi:MYXO-CTERM domain-containing protein
MTPSGGARVTTDSHAPHISKPFQLDDDLTAGGCSTSSAPTGALPLLLALGLILRKKVRGTSGS